MSHRNEIFCLFLLPFICYLKSANAYFEMHVPDNKNVFDLKLYDDVLDPKLCEEQIDYIIKNDTDLLVEFLDAGVRFPRGVLAGNLVDLGNYYQCLAIGQATPNSRIEGKYCVVSLPLDQKLEIPSLPSVPEWPEFPWPEFPWPGINTSTTRMGLETINRLNKYNILKSGVQTLIGAGKSSATDTPISDLTFDLALCIPKSCSTQRVFNSIRGLNYTEQFCRLPNDKAWASVDYVALAVFSLIILLTILSTVYDVHHQKYLNKDPKKISKLYQSFSVYTNTRRLVTYTAVPGAIECLDGIRSLAMLWVIVGHTFSSQVSDGIMANPLDTMQWMTSLSAIWITSAPITVDTFFMLSGLLLVYTTAGKLTGSKLLKNLHLFYLNRLLRIYPALAAVILMQASLFNWVADGPYWGEVVAPHIHRCRVYWWPAILHVQNFLTPDEMCLPHSWYIAIDVQLYIASPLVLYWVLGKRRSVAWVAMIGALLAVLAGATTYNVIKAFPSGTIIPSRPDEMTYFINEHYLNTLVRASPFFIGMIVGYVLHLYRKQKAVINPFLLAFLWACAAVIFALILYSSYPIMQMDWDNQVADDMINSFMRAGWAIAVGWMIIACVQGYGGLINWILSLRMWKVPSRMSFAMYLVHYPMIFIVNGMAVTPIFFSVRSSLFTFLAHLTLASLVAFLLTILIEAPFSTLVKLFMGGGQRRTPTKSEVEKMDTAGDDKPNDMLRKPELNINNNKTYL